MTRSLTLMLALAMGCAEVPVARPRGPVITEISRELRVCVDQGSLEVGTVVRFVRAVCKQRHPKRPWLECQAQPTGSGRVVRLLEARCAIVDLSLDAEAQPGDEVVLP